MQRSFLTLAIALVLSAPSAFAYQVTGPVVEADATHITVMKGKEKWELARDASTKVTGDLKPGSKVTIQYSMTATSVEVKDATAAKPAATTKPVAAKAKP